jgi:hypothetical protein
MRAICYENTLTNLPGWVNTVHIEQKYGYAYETDTHFIHLYGKEPFYIISTGLTVSEGKNGSLNDWALRRFGARNIQPMTLEVGHTIEGIWRPSLYFWEDICSAIKVQLEEQLSEESALRILVQQLDNLLLYIEPSQDGLESFGHKTRELLILACTEIENQWRSLLEKSGTLPTNGRAFTTQDYVKLIAPTYLQEFSLNLRNNLFPVDIKPFLTWNSALPTQSLAWYNAYNETKHNRDGHFSSAKLRHVIDAIAANIIFYSIRFSPLSLINNTNAFSGIVNQMFTIKMNDSDRTSFYIPLIDNTKIQRSDCIVIDSYREKLNENWITQNLVL